MSDSEGVDMDDLFGEGEGGLDAAGGAGPLEASPRAGAAAASPVVAAAPAAGAFVRAAAAAAAAAAGASPANARGRTILHLPSLPRAAEGDGVVVLRLPRILGTTAASYNPALPAAGDADRVQTLIRHRVAPVGGGGGGGGGGVGGGAPERASNARVVEWSDGSLTLHVGKEVFSMRRAGESAAAETTEYVFAVTDSQPPPGSVGKHEVVLQCLAPVKQRIVAGALASDTSQLSRLQAREASSRAVKRARTGEHVVVDDAEATKEAVLRSEQAAARAAELKRRKAEAAAKKEKRGGSGGGYGEDDEGEEEEDSDVVNLKKLKAGLKSGGGRGAARGRAAAATADDDDGDVSSSSGSSSSGSSSGSSSSGSSSSGSGSEE